MKLFLDCYPCVLRQVLSLARLLDLDQSQAKTAMDHTLQLLLHVDAGSSPPQVMTAVYRHIHETFFAGKETAAGNIIDFAAQDHGTLNISAEIRGIPELSFAIYDIQPMLRLLEGARTLVYVGDNAGEIVFDRVLIRQLRRAYPDLEVVFPAPTTSGCFTSSG